MVRVRALVWRCVVWRCAVVLLACSDGPARTPAEQIKADADGAALVEVEDGVIRTVQGRIKVDPSVGSDPVAQARWFAGKYRAGFALEDPATELVDNGVEQHDERTVVTFARVSGGLPVLGGALRVHVATGYIEYAITTLPAEVTVAAAPAISMEDAAAAAAQSTGAAAVGTPTLAIFNRGVFTGGLTPSALAWQVELANGRFAVIDAATGAEVWGWTTEHEALARNTSTANHQINQADLLAGIGATLWLDENGPVSGVTPDQDGLDAHAAAQVVYEFYSRLGRDGVDNKGALLKTFVHYGTTSNYASSYDGALWFTDGMMELDVFAHEYTHSVVDETANFVYAGESGALHESFADIMAVFMSPAGSGHWVLAEDTAIGTQRSLSNPGALGHARHFSAFHALPAGVAPTGGPGGNDNGEVHYNAGITNYALYLLVTGGVHADSDVAVPGIGENIAQLLYYEALSHYLLPASRFRDLADALRAACFHFVVEAADSHGITFGTCGAVLRAMFAVGITKHGDDDLDGWPNNFDVCPIDYDPLQDDSNRDGRGNACDGGVRPDAPWMEYPTSPPVVPTCPASVLGATWTLELQEAPTAVEIISPQLQVYDEFQQICRYRHVMLPMPSTSTKCTLHWQPYDPHLYGHGLDGYACTRPGEAFVAGSDYYLTSATQIAWVTCWGNSIIMNDVDELAGALLPVIDPLALMCLPDL